MNTEQAKAKNLAYAEQIKAALNTVIADTYTTTISVTLKAVVMSTWQDSSNAASNWYVVSHFAGLPEYSSNRGHSPIGASGDHRSVNQAMGDMTAVANFVAQREKGVIDRIFKAKNPKDFSFYNAVERSLDGSVYAINAEIYKALHDPEVAVAFNKTSTAKFQEWKSKYRF